MMIFSGLQYFPLPAFGEKIFLILIGLILSTFSFSISFAGDQQKSELLNKLCNIENGECSEELYLAIFREFDYTRDFENLISVVGDDSLNLDQRLDALAVMAPLAEVSDSGEHFAEIANLLDSSVSVDIVTQQAMFISFVYMVLARVDEDKAFELCKERFVKEFWTEDKIVAPLPNDISMDRAIDLLRSTSISGMARVGNDNAIRWIEKVGDEVTKSSDPLEPVSMTLRDAKTFLIDADRKLRKLAQQANSKVNGRP